MPLPRTAIEVTEKFPALSHAPVTEAVIAINSRPEDGWEEKIVSSAFKAQLPDYPEQESQRGMQGMVQIKLGKDATVANPSTTISDLGFYGVRATSVDKRQIVQLLRDNFVFSRLAPYERWDKFRDEALRLWKIYKEFGARNEIQRLGLRFINQIPLVPGEYNLDDYMTIAPKESPALPLNLAGFFHSDTLSVPGHPYFVNFISTIQPSPNGIALIIDIDVFRGPFSLGDVDLEFSLAEMRWLKNKLFFGSVTQKTLSFFQ
jgi:uncharacterized protein (TIGR04255 family)